MEDKEILEEAQYLMKRTSRIGDYAVRIVEAYKEVESRTRELGKNLLTFLSNS